MSCEQWRDKLDAYVDDPLAVEATGVEDHLRACPSCAAEVLSRAQLKRATRAAAMRYVPSPEFRQRIEKSIRPKRRASRFGLWIPSLAAAVATLLLIVWVVVWDRHRVQQQAIAELLDMHVATLASSNPVDVVSTDRHTVKPWFQGRLPFTFNLPELGGTQFRLIGGRVAWLDRSPAAQLLFGTEKHSLSVFISQEQQGVIPLIEAGAARERGFHTETWSEGGMRYTVVSDAGAGDVHGLAELLRAAAKQ